MRCVGSTARTSASCWLGAATRAQLERALDEDRAELLPVGPLSIGATHLLLQRRLGRQFPRPTLIRVHEISGGNPFYALELARGLGSDTATGDPLRRLPVPETLERLVSTRLAGLGDAAREALLLTAAHGRPSPRLLNAAGTAPNALEPAFAAHVVEHADAVIRFTHPLLASVLYQGAGEEERQRAHGRLAAVVDDPVERTRHLALASSAPDEAVASALEEAAELAGNRAAISEAAELAEHALRLTPPDALEDRHRRTIAAARAHLEAADTSRARALGLDLLSRSHGGGRAEALVLLSDIEDADLELEPAIERRREALEAAPGLALQAEIHQWLAQALPFTEGAAAGDQHAEIALELGEALDDDALRAGALSVLAFGRFRAGVPGALSLVDRAIRLTKPEFDARLRREIYVLALNSLMWANQLSRARMLYAGIDAEWSERDERVHAAVLWGLAKIEFHAGRFQLAADHAELARETRRQYTIDDREVLIDVWLVALIAAHRGELDRVRALVESTRPLATISVDRSGHDGVLGLVELWSGHPGEAAILFAAADEDRLGSGVNEPALFWWRADYAEALLALGRVDEADALVDAWDADAARLGRETVVAHATRCRGLVAAARGEIEVALAELARAVEQHEAVGDPFGRARALLALGTVRRRARQKRAAREAIEAALDGFEECGAAGWAEKARAELGTIGGRKRIEGLTPAEDRIAALVASGQTNREVAAALFLTEQTVATTLTRVYRKLGVRSRVELASRHAAKT